MQKGVQLVNWLTDTCRIVYTVRNFKINVMEKTNEINDWVKKVYDWHEKFGVDIGVTPKFIEGERFEMRHRILKEEVNELEEAFWMVDKDISDVADAICDILYVVIGTAIEFGLHDKMTLLFDEVHRSNMSKLDENGSPVKREDGKILKSKLFSPPNLKDILTHA